MKFSSRKLCATGFAVILILGIMGNVNKNYTYDKVEVDISYYLKTVNKLNEMSVSKVEEQITKPDYDLDLDEKYQNLIWELCEKNNLSYELALAVIYQESKFKHNAINYNSSNSVDRGIMQINNYSVKDYIKWGKQYCDLPSDVEFNVNDPSHNIRAGLGGIIYFNNYYKKKGVAGEFLPYYVLGSYNRGKVGFENYLKDNGFIETEYANIILEYKLNLERYGRLEM